MISNAANPWYPTLSCAIQLLESLNVCVNGGAVTLRRVGVPANEHHTRKAVQSLGYAIACPSELAAHFGDRTLADQVLKSFDLDEKERIAMAHLVGRSIQPTTFNHEQFHQQISGVLDRFQLDHMFWEDPADFIPNRGYHLNLRPKRQSDIPGWQRCYRALDPIQRIFALTLVYLYSGQRKCVWLHRQRVSWSMGAAIAELERRDALEAWVMLCICYSAW